jgi:ribonuclease J
MLKLVALGGLGEIGLNSLIVERGEDLFLIDCGLLFPTALTPGVDAIVPDFNYLRAHASQLKGVVLTHGHEDHVGALAWLLREFPVPVYGSPFALGVANSRLEERGIKPDLRELTAGGRASFGALEVEPFAVCHSTPDATGLIVRTPEGTLVHTGDFKLDDDPLDGRRTDLGTLRALGDEGVLCLLSDSTNVETLEETRSEREVAETFRRLVTPMRGRVVVALFASNLARVQHLLDLFASLNRRVVLFGRSVARNVELAQKVGQLRVPEGLLVSSEHAATLPREQVAILSTGAQAEPRSGLFGLLGEGSPIPLERGDAAIISARAIPGNERAVAGLLDLLYARSLTVVHQGIEPSVHASGHASRPQQRRMIETVRPRAFVPVHGELRHLHEHRAVAVEAGVQPQHALVARDGDVVGFEDGRPRIVAQVPAGRRLIDRWGGGHVGPDAISERLSLADGIVTAVVVLDRDSGELLTDPQLSGRGLASDEIALLTEASREVRSVLEEISPVLRVDEALTREELARAVRRVFKARLGKRPVVVPQVLKL